MAVYTCKCCGVPLTVEEGQKTVECPFCKTKFTVAELESDEVLVSKKPRSSNSEVKKKEEPKTEKKDLVAPKDEKKTNKQKRFSVSDSKKDSSVFSSCWLC